MLTFAEFSYAAVIMIAYQRIRRGSDQTARKTLIALMNGREFDGLADGTLEEIKRLEIKRFVDNLRARKG